MREKSVAINETVQHATFERCQGKAREIILTGTLRRETRSAVFSYLKTMLCCTNAALLDISKLVIGEENCLHRCAPLLDHAGIGLILVVNPEQKTHFLPLMDAQAAAGNSVHLFADYQRERAESWLSFYSHLGISRSDLAIHAQPAHGAMT